MSIITTILQKEIITINHPLNIIWTECIDTNFKWLVENLGHNLIDFNHAYYGCLQPHLIICNNKVQFFDKCKMFSIQYHLPVLLIDHQMRSNLLDINKIYQLNDLPCVHKIAISQKISESWNNDHDQILSYNSESREIWKNLIYQVAKKTFQL